MKELEIRKYEDIYHQQFKEISLDWLHKNHLYEKADDDLLENPMKYIANGSFIFLASSGVNNLIFFSNKRDLKYSKLTKYSVIDDK